MTYEDIKEQFNQVIAYSQGIPEPKTDKLFEDWLNAKRNFIEAFGGRLIVEAGHVSFTLDKEEKRVRLDDFISTVYETYNNQALGSFLEQEQDGFFENVVTRDYEARKGTIQKGMKLVKAFKFFEEDKRTLEALQDCASRVIQENKIEGTLCFSVHPLDYLSSSLNTYNWRSCHALDGEYRSGNLSYMVDKSTIICYLKGADNVTIPLFPESVPWNSKKWRMLLYFSESWDMLFAGRQYPFSSTPGLSFVKDKLLEIIYPRHSIVCAFGPWDNRYADYETTGLPLDFKYIPVRGELLLTTDVIKDGDHSLQFNDLLRSSCYTNPWYSVRNNYSWCRWEHLPPRFTIGGAVDCLHCGKQHITNPETMMCDDCELDFGHEENDVYGACDCCGARLVRDDATWVGDNLVCDACYHSQCFICDCCDEIYFNTDKIYDKEQGDYVCKYCYDARRER